MYEFARPLNDLIEQLRRIPGVGAKTAQRMAFHILAMPEADALQLAESIRLVKSRIFTCSRCNAITHVDPCETCSDPSRSDDALCVVEEPFNIASIEKTGSFRGRYHVLMGALSPLKGKGPDEVGVDKLVARVEAGSFKEIIIATNPTVEGEATAVYLQKVLSRFGIKISRIAMGLPVGSDIDYADQVTMKRALDGRTEMKE
jgi:recombination protein RecR